MVLGITCLDQSSEITAKVFQWDLDTKAGRRVCKEPNLVSRIAYWDCAAVDGSVRRNWRSATGMFVAIIASASRCCLDAVPTRPQPNQPTRATPT